ncbi:MAG: hypothetical protein HYX32_14435 [Actinobacteria bacterium]|nr:hypothetical protein [Actinomycetota bacterium]
MIALIVVVGLFVVSLPRIGVLALVFGPLCASIGYLIIRRQSEGAPFDLANIMLAGLALRFLGAYFRFVLAADSRLYHNIGLQLAASMRQLNFAVSSGRQVPGTGSLDYISGLTGVLTFDDYFGQMLVFTMLAFAGACMFYKAFCVGFPDGDHKRYALLVFFLPTLVFWPSSLGKDGWMQFGLGLASLGAAHMFRTRMWRGILYVLVGLGAIALIRPHVDLMIVFGLAVAALARGSAGSKVKMGGRIAAVLILIIGGGYLASWTSDVLKVDNLGADTIDAALNNTEEQTGEGGSQFTAARVRTPLDYPLAFTTVMFRPFPGEVRDPLGLLASAETLFLLGLAAASWRRLARLPSLFVHNNYVAYATAYMILFVFAFSAISNFGILSRQRAQVLPLALVALALPVAPPRAKADADEPRERRWHRRARRDGSDPSPPARDDARHSRKPARRRDANPAGETPVPAGETAPADDPAVAPVPKRRNAPARR